MQREKKKLTTRQQPKGIGKINLVEKSKQGEKKPNLKMIKIQFLEFNKDAITTRKCSNKQLIKKNPFRFQR